MNQLEKSPHEHTNTPKNTHEGPRQHTRAPNIYKKTGPTNTNTSWTTDNRTHQKGTKQQAKGTKGRPKEPTTKVENRTRASQLHRRTPGPLDGSSNDSTHCSSAAGSSLQDLLLSSPFNLQQSPQDKLDLSQKAEKRCLVARHRQAFIALALAYVHAVASTFVS